MSAAEKALWYIESHSSEDLSLAQVARVVGVSPFHLSRLFSGATGQSLVRYMRGRRLTQAAIRLANGAADILEVAVGTGYGSHEAFTRAFRERFDTTPEEVRLRGSVVGLAVVDPIRIPHGAPAIFDEPQCIAMGELLVAGIAAHYVDNAFAGIPAQWQRLMTRSDLARLRGSVALGVFYREYDGDDTDYLAGFEVSDFRGMGNAWTTLRIPPSHYVVATHRGHISSIWRTWQHFVGEWLPGSGLVIADAPEFERYGDDFDPRTGEGTVGIWLPLASPETPS